MPQFNSASKALAHLFFRRRKIICSNTNKIRYLSSIAAAGAFSSADKMVTGGYRSNNFRDYGILSSKSNIVIQKREFLGCGDGEVGNVLSKVYEERRVIGYSPEQLFNVVAAVDTYEDFLPWCQRSDIIHRNPDGTFDAELEIGFKVLVESYVSHVELNKPKSIKTSSSQSCLFDHLINVWEFSPGTVPGTCNLYFLVDFKFRSLFY